MITNECSKNSCNEIGKTYIIGVGYLCTKCLKDFEHHLKSLIIRPVNKQKTIEELKSFIKS